MARLCLYRGRQREFLKRVKAYFGGGWDEIAGVCKVHPRTIRDWAREKYYMNYGTAVLLSKITNTIIPNEGRILPEYWSVKKASKLGGKRHFGLYGPPGTIESRRKGGLRSQEKFRADPELAKKKGFITRKSIKSPKKSSDLAEFIGIMLGDGGIWSNYQISISFNMYEDIKYANYIQGLVTRLFSLSSKIRIREKYGNGDIVVSGRNLVDFLERHGVKKGNKVTKKVDIPKWIWTSEDYKIGCLRGLIDTDGCFYRHKYRVNGKEYTYLKMCFTSYSPPLLKSVTTILKDLGFNPRNTAKNRVYLYTLPQLHRYFRKVNSRNPRYLNIYRNFCKSL